MQKYSCLQVCCQSVNLKMAIRAETCSWYLCNKQHISNYQIVVFDSWLIQLKLWLSSLCVNSGKIRIVGDGDLTGDISRNSLRGMEKGWKKPQILQPLSGKRSKPESPQHYSRWPTARPQVSVCIVQRENSLIHSFVRYVDNRGPSKQDYVKPKGFSDS